MSTVPPPGQENQYCDGNFEMYQGLYEGAAGYKAIGDASPGYLWDPNAPRKIQEVCPGARIIILLRDPVERAYSAFLMQQRVNHAPMSFMDMAQSYRPGERREYVWGETPHIEQGLYYEQVKRYFEIFGREQVAVHLFDDLEREPRQLAERIATHIGIDPQLLRAEDFGKVYNQTRSPRFALLFKVFGPQTRAFLRTHVLPQSVRERLNSSSLLYKFEKPPRDDRASRHLQAIYEPDISRLEDLLERKLPELRRTWI